MKTGGTSKRIRVLTVEEQPIVRAGLKVTLQRSNAADFVGEASGHEDAVRKAKRLDPDVVLFGLGGGEQSEVQALQTLRQQAPNAKVLVLGRDEDARYIIRLLRAGAHGYTSKMSSTSELIEATKAVFRAEVYLSAAVAEEVLSAAEPGDARGEEERPDPKLTPRESQVLNLIARGLTNRQIAVELGISARTVETYRERIMRKLDIHTVAGLTRYAIERGADE